jgi:hypothetical protein
MRVYVRVYFWVKVRWDEDVRYGCIFGVKVLGGVAVRMLGGVV